MSVTLVHPEEQVPVAATRLIEKCTLFKTNPALVGAPYAVKSAIPIRVFREFLSALEGEAVEVTNANFGGLSLLSTEFGFDGLTAQLSAFRSSGAFAGEVADAEARARIAALEARAHARDKDLAGLRAEVARLSAAVKGGEARARALREGQALASAAVEGLRAEVSALKARPPAPPGAAPEPRPPERSLRGQVARSNPGLPGVSLSARQRRNRNHERELSRALAAVRGVRLRWAYGTAVGVSLLWGVCGGGGGRGGACTNRGAGGAGA
jgi:hypothetical protein